MNDEYPTEVELRKIKRWKLEYGDYNDLIEFVKSIWKYDSIHGRWGIDDLDKSVYKLQIHTMGWSGNEDIIYALQESKSLFWMVCWVKSERGGHYYFEIPIDFYKKKLK